MNNIKTCFIATITTLSLSAPVLATTGKVSINLSTLGTEVEYSHTINDQVAIRAGMGIPLNMDTTVESSGINFDTSVDIGHNYILGDYFLENSGFRASAGIFTISNEISMSADVDTNIEVGTHTVPAAQVKSFGGSLSLSGTAPFVGVGYAAAPTDGGLGFSFDIGATAFPKLSGGLTLVCEGDATASPACHTAQAEVVKENDDLNAEFKTATENIPFLPVVSTGISYSF